MNGANQMVNMDDKIFNFVLNYAKVMGILEETEINLTEIGKSVITRKSGQKQVGIVELNDLFPIVNIFSLGRSINHSNQIIENTIQFDIITVSKPIITNFHNFTIRTIIHSKYFRLLVIRKTIIITIQHHIN